MKLWLNSNERLILEINGVEVHFQALPHPTVVGTAHTIESNHSSVFHLQEISRGGAEYALKIMSPPWSGPQIYAICDFLTSLRSVAGLQCCDRLCLTKDNAPKTIARYKELEFAIIMPWVRGTTWSDVHAAQAASTDGTVETVKGLSNLTRWHCLQYAICLCDVLATMEKQQLSHCNLGPENIVLAFDQSVPAVELLGLEGIFNSHIDTAPSFFNPMGEYKHRQDTRPNLASDRFSGALLLAEILAWYDDDIRVLFRHQSDSLFTIDELHQTSNPKFVALSKAVGNHHRDLAELLRMAWSSQTSDNAPAMLAWLNTLHSVNRTKIEYAWVRPQARPSIPRTERFWHTAENAPFLRSGPHTHDQETTA